jgi:hypothetical protein
VAQRDTRVDAYIKSAAPFAQPILRHLREVVHAACPDVVETIKWRSPFFDYRGPMCHMAAFKHHCAFGFWKGELVAPADADAARGQFGRLESVADLPSKRQLVAYVRKAMALADAGIAAPHVAKRARPKPPPVPSAPFKQALRAAPIALATFEAFSAAQQREYVDWIAEAKREETRDRRIAQAVEWLAAGKMRNWKYL